MAVVVWLAVSLVFFRLDLAHGLYFHMGETEKKCFIEEIPDETMVIGEFGDPQELLGGRQIETIFHGFDIKLTTFRIMLCFHRYLLLEQHIENNFTVIFCNHHIRITFKT